MSIQLAPDLEAGVRAAAAERGIPADLLVSEAVKAYLRQTSTDPQLRRVPFNDLSAEMAWAANPEAQYIGQWGRAGWR